MLKITVTKIQEVLTLVGKMNDSKIDLQISFDDINVTSLNKNDVFVFDKIYPNWTNETLAFNDLDGKPVLKICFNFDENARDHYHDPIKNFETLETIVIEDLINGSKEELKKYVEVKSSFQ
jgi:hypothetical protein